MRWSPATFEPCWTGRSRIPSGGSPSRPRSTPRRWSCSPRARAATRGWRSRRSSARRRPRGPGAIAVDLDAAEDALQRKALSYDREGDRHYDYISAWIKATRASDPDASLYYLAVMLEGGEDPRFIARRMVILASEDVGNADPQALVVANAAAEAVDRVGLPECRLNLAQAAAYLALAPKSNASYRGIQRATAHVREHGAKPPPAYLRDAHYPGARKLGRGIGYVYPHDRAGRRRRPAGDAGGPRGRALLRADRPWVRGGASDAGSRRFDAVLTSPGAAQARKVRAPGP